LLSQAESKALAVERKENTPYMIRLLRTLGLSKINTKGISSAALKRMCQLNTNLFQHALEQPSAALMRDAALDQIATYFKGFPSIRLWGEQKSRGKLTKSAFEITKVEFFAKDEKADAKMSKPMIPSTMNQAQRLQASIWGADGTSTGASWIDRTKASSTSSAKSPTLRNTTPATTSLSASAERATIAASPSSTHDIWGPQRLTPFVS